ncbi:hypothetical protein [Henriciella sp.]|uniref:hypothetical protein n=1 Tax=Henriciella sp. TaxID=1968823 RepID=UPI0026227679|nr:hypothetical protein [Henriciella sp.]
MSRRTKTVLYAAGAFLVLLLVIFLMAWQQGVNPFHPRTRMYWLLAVVVALYVSIRGAVFVERMQFRKSQKPLSPEDAPSRYSSKLSDRMAARKARVEAALKQADQQKDS